MNHTTNVSNNLEELVQLALNEDFGDGDVTSQYFVSPDLKARALMRTREVGVLSGVEVAAKVFQLVDPSLRVEIIKADGEAVVPGDAVMLIEGKAQSILGAERTALNFIQRLAGVASMTNRYVQLIKHTNCKLLDTRKTTPGYRLLEKAAVVHGGGQNHRLGLYDRAMVKDNHLMTGAQSSHLQASIDKLKADKPHVEVELEADRLDQVAAFLELRGVDYILLDNMSNEQMAQAVAMRGEREKPYFEASGGLTAATATAAAETGVDFMSFGCLTHSVPSLDLGLDFTVES
ncbi:MAG: carboxylating nicotinate-nucleotide diphosphorylase [Akkermansia sp.]